MLYFRHGVIAKGKQWEKNEYLVFRKRDVAQVTAMCRNEAKPSFHSSFATKDGRCLANKSDALLVNILVETQTLEAEIHLPGRSLSTPRKSLSALGQYRVDIRGTSRDAPPLIIKVDRHCCFLVPECRLLAVGRPSSSLLVELQKVHREENAASAIDRYPGPGVCWSRAR